LLARRPICASERVASPVTRVAGAASSSAFGARSRSRTHASAPEPQDERRRVGSLGPGVRARRAADHRGVARAASDEGCDPGLRIRQCAPAPCSAWACARQDAPQCNPTTSPDGVRFPCGREAPLSRAEPGPASPAHVLHRHAGLQADPPPAVSDPPAPLEPFGKQEDRRIESPHLVEDLPPHQETRTCEPIRVTWDGVVLELETKESRPDSRWEQPVKTRWSSQLPEDPGKGSCRVLQPPLRALQARPGDPRRPAPSRGALPGGRGRRGRATGRRSSGAGSTGPRSG
jgi:hypothetical protein